MSVLIAAFGHAWLSDQRFSLDVIERLRACDLPADTLLEDWSFGTLAAFQKLAALRCERAAFIDALPGGAPPGTLRVHMPARVGPDPAEVHARVCDCAMGAVSLDHLLAIAAHYQALPPDVLVIRAEPVSDGWGTQLSPEIAALVDPALTRVRAWLGGSSVPHDSSRTTSRT